MMLRLFFFLIFFTYSWTQDLASLLTDNDEIPELIVGEECGRQPNREQCLLNLRCCWVFVVKDGSWKYPTCVDRYSELEGYFNSWNDVPGLSYDDYKEENKFENGTCDALNDLFHDMKDYGYDIQLVEPGCSCQGMIFKLLVVFNLVLTWLLI